MSLREIQQGQTLVTVFLLPEPLEDAPVDGGEDGGGDDGGDDGAGSPAPAAAGTRLAESLGLIDPSGNTAHSGWLAYRVLGFKKDQLWCDSTTIVALDPGRVADFTGETNCPDIPPGKLKTIRIPRTEAIPFVTLEYRDSLLSFLEDESGDLQILDKPTLDARLEEAWCDGSRCYARIWLEGSYKGKHKTATITFSYDPLQNKVCVGHGTFKNDYIRVKDIETCWYIDRSVICVSARVEWRPNNDIYADLEACIPLLKSSMEPPKTGSCRFNIPSGGVGCISPITHQACKQIPSSKFKAGDSCHEDAGFSDGDGCNCK
ncbi:hypothetical protein NA78x_001759 [Anatilimnocola sp. NA78]|uniref:hypothetical protein n=1 Tax=Anatilimnocola sp. NA78 TaxID=3415683 RepID=UPI003CE4B55A